MTIAGTCPDCDHPWFDHDKYRGCRVDSFLTGPCDCRAELVNASVTITLDRDEAQATFVALERLRLGGTAHSMFRPAAQEAEHKLYDALKEIDAHDF